MAVVLASAGGSSDVGRDDVGGIAVQRAAGAVVAAGLAGICVAGVVLHIAQAAARVQRRVIAACRSEWGEMA